MPDVVVVNLLGGPCDDDRCEVPPGQPEIWRHRAGRYHLYRLLPPNDRSYLYADVSLDERALADRLASEGQNPWLHRDAPTPHSRHVPIEPVRPDG